MPVELVPAARRFAPALVALLLALAARHWLIEPAPIAFGCEPAPWTGLCALRSLLIAGFVNQEIGWLAFAAGAGAVAVRSRRLASLALALGCAGLVLYSYEPSAIGALLGLLVLARGQAQPASTSIAAE